jgi:hypothetical protein
MQVLDCEAHHVAPADGAYDRRCLEVLYQLVELALRVVVQSDADVGDHVQHRITTCYNRQMSRDQTEAPVDEELAPSPAIPEPPRLMLPAPVLAEVRRILRQEARRMLDERSGT